MNMIAAPIKTKIKEMGFKEKTTQELHKLFKLSRKKKSALLDNWLAMSYTISKEEADFLEKLRDLAEFKIPYWNEDELKLHLIHPLIHKVNYYNLNYSLFAERSISALFKNNILLKGKADLMLASGDSAPDIPFFFFQEYKKEKGTADDPIAQLLAAMLVGQQLNSSDKPVYGSYVMGRMWFFVVMEKNKYTISNMYGITLKEHLEKIYAALQNIKVIIDRDLI